jgi:hypothetical protein
MIQKTRQLFQWKNLHADCMDYVKRCEHCLRHSRSKTEREDMHCEPSTFAFQECSSDLLEYNGDTFLLIIDRLSSWWEQLYRYGAAGLSGEKTTDCFRQWFARYGAPERLRTDGGPQFSSGRFSDLMKEFDISHRVSSPHHARSNGHAEAGVKAV